MTADLDTAPAPTSLTLRSALVAGAAVATAVAVGAPTRARAATPALAADPPRRPNPRDPGRRQPPLPVAGLLVEDRAAHLVRRLTYGAAPGLVEQVRAMGERAFIDSQLNPSAIDDSGCDRALSERFLSLGWTSKQVVTQWPNLQWDAMLEVVRATLLRAVVSKRQLYELMVEFWSNHLNITTPSDKVWDVRTVDDREVARRHALGSFSDLLLASGSSPAMLRYLDNADSRGIAPNENYGRELLELHTLGVNGGYTEVDVKQATLALTGWTVDWDSRLFVFRPDWHYTGPLKVMGWSHPNAAKDAGGIEVGRSLLRYLARHRSTATRIATKLAVRFVSDTPSPALVKTLADTYLSNDTRIVPVLRVLFAHPEFWSSAGMKTRRPYDNVVASLRILGTTAPPDPDRTTAVDAWAGWGWQLYNAGHAPLGWGPPNGYPDTAREWAGAATTLSTWNMHAAATDHWFRTGMTTQDLTARYGPDVPGTCGALVDRVCLRLLGQVMRPEHRAGLLAFLEKGWADPVPSWFWENYLSPLTRLVLDSPYWSVR